VTEQRKKEEKKFRINYLSEAIFNQKVSQLLQMAAFCEGGDNLMSNIISFPFLQHSSVAVLVGSISNT
jgi:hypothetical protein